MDKPPLWADLLLTVWVVIVAVIYFGGFFYPDSIGVWTGKSTVFYALMVLVSALVLAGRYLKRS